MIIGINSAGIRDKFEKRKDWLSWIVENFDALELSLGEFSSPGESFYLSEITRGEIEEIKSIIKPLKRIAIHTLGYNNSDLTSISPYKEIRKIYRDIIKKSIEFGKRIGAEIIVFHSGGTCCKAVTEKDIERYLSEELKELDKISSGTGIKLALENADYFHKMERFEFFKNLPLSNIGICLDTGHSYAPGAGVHVLEEAGHGYTSYKTVGNFIKRFKEKIIHIHIHDYDPVHFPRMCGHQPLGKGIIDFDEIISSLKEINYPGILSFELGQKTLDEILDSKAKLIKLGTHPI